MTDGPDDAQRGLAALARYVALTGDAQASLADPCIRTFCEAYEDAAADVRLASEVEIRMRYRPARLDP